MEEQIKPLKLFTALEAKHFLVSLHILDAWSFTLNTIFFLL